MPLVTFFVCQRLTPTRSNVVPSPIDQLELCLAGDPPAALTRKEILDGQPFAQIAYEGVAIGREGQITWAAVSLFGHGQSALTTIIVLAVCIVISCGCWGRVTGVFPI